MAIPPNGTFDYVGIMPVGDGPPWTVPMETAVDRRDVRLPSLAGASPWLRIEEAGLTPNAGYARGVWRPSVLRARFSLTTDPSSRLTGTVGALHLDLALTRALKPGDTLHVSRTSAGGIGISVLRSGRLVVALGAVTSVPLGEHIVVRIPGDLIAEAEAVFKRRDPAFEFAEYPLEISVDSETPWELASFVAHSFSSGPERPSAYEIAVDHGPIRGIPGTDESALIFHRGLCSAPGAHASAQLLAADGLDLTHV
jgi:hypothetical protein